MMESLDSQLFNEIGKIATKVHPKVYPTLPQFEVPYPFIALGEIQVIPRRTSTRLLGKAYATIYVWGSDSQRDKVGEIVERLAEESHLIALETRTLKQVINASNRRILAHNENTDNLWQGILQLEFNII